MDKIIQFIKDFGNLINLAVLISFYGYFIFTYKAKNDAAIESQNARIKLLEKQLEIQSEFTIEKVAVRFRFLKEYYEVHVKDSETLIKEWFKKSIESLRQEKEEAIRQKEIEYEARIEEEILKRKELVEKYTNPKSSEYKYDYVLTNADDIVGKYYISGSNPGVESNNSRSYFGVVDIIKQNKELFKVTWEVGHLRQKLEGIGILSNNTLSVAFSEVDQVLLNDLYGLAVYRVINNEILRGVWTTPKSDQVGSEELRRIV